MTTRARCERCQRDVEPVRGVDPLGEGLFPLRVCPDCGEEVSPPVTLEDPEPQPGAG
jgi:hypothetical protein